MGFFKNLFKRKNKNQKNNIKEEYSLETHENIEDIINIDKYISRKDFQKISNDSILNEENFEKLKEHNNSFIKSKIESEKEYLDTILKACDPKIMLDNEQREVVLSDEDYTLVIAGAGAGKTTTIAAKVKYLVDKQNINPKDILVVSFTNKAVNELKERINQQLNINCPITTFHAAGYSILKKEQKDLTTLNIASDYVLYNTVNNYIMNEVINDKETLRNILLFFSSYFYMPKECKTIEDFYHYLSRTDFSTLKSNIGEYYKDVLNKRSHMRQTLRDEVVRSEQEVIIANFLFMNGIDYEYESIYPKPFPGSLKPYTPDFLLKQDDKIVYLEHFSLDENDYNSMYTVNQMNEYKKRIQDKIKFHKDNGTKLIYTRSSYNDGKHLLVHLKDILLNEGFELRPKDDLEIYQKLKKVVDNKYLNSFIFLIKRFIENFKVCGYNVNTFDEFINRTNNERSKIFLQIAKEAYKNYQKNLKENNQIDFADMINESAKMLQEKIDLKEKLHFKYIFVDEYQDISKQRFDLTKALSELCDAKIIAVGDDWQSIYAFSGSDINLFTSFKEKFGYAQELKITKTYRNSQEVINIAGNFVQENEAQIKKELKSEKHIDDPVLIYTYEEDYNKLKEQNFKNRDDAKYKKVEDAIGKIVEFNIKEGKKNTEILLIGRYGFDGYKINSSPYFEFDKKTNIIKSYKYPNAKIIYMNAHSSKGLGFDNVIIINAINTKYGFPSQIENDTVLDFVINDDKNIKYAEERRLFYVALTRTKNRIFIIAPKQRPSEFVLELKEKYNDVKVDGELKPEDTEKNIKRCPICGFPLQLRFHPSFGLKLYMCTNDNELCEFMTNDIHGGKLQICKCDKCNDGYMVVKHSVKNNEYFLGCTNYDTIRCNNTYSKEDFYKEKYK